MLIQSIQVARDEDLAEQIGRDIYFDLVDHDKVRSFRIQKQMPFYLFKVCFQCLVCPCRIIFKQGSRRSIGKFRLGCWYFLLINCICLICICFFVIASELHLYAIKWQVLFGSGATSICHATCINKIPRFSLIILNDNVSCSNYLYIFLNPLKNWLSLLRMRVSCLTYLCVCLSVPVCWRDLEWISVCINNYFRATWWHWFTLWF